MTPTEAMNAFDQLASTVGPKAEFSIFLNTSRYGLRSKDQGALKAVLYATGSYSAGSLFCCDGDTWEALLEAAATKWSEHSEEHRRRTTLDMALAIIRITDTSGVCSDQSLRAEFDAADVKRFGADACAKANEMAGRGPFKITETFGANDCAEAA